MVLLRSILFLFLVSQFVVAEEKASQDNGVSWSVPQLTNFADSRARFCTGRLPDGRFYIISNPGAGRSRRFGTGNRTLLTIAFSKDGTLFDFEATWGTWARQFIDDLARGDSMLAGRLAAEMQFDLARGTFKPSSPVIAGTPSDIADCLLPHLPGESPSSLISQMNVSAARAPQAEIVPGLSGDAQ